MKNVGEKIAVGLTIVSIFGAGFSTAFTIGMHQSKRDCDQRVEQARDNVSLSYEKLPAGWYEVVEAIPERQVALVSALDRSEYIPPFVVREMPTKLTKGKKFQTRSRPYTGR